MHGINHMAWGLALVAFAAGGLLIAAGATKKGRRLISVGVVLVLVVPLLEAGIVTLADMEVRHGSALNKIAIVLLLAAVVLAGVVALGRSRRRGGASSTSLKKRVDD